MPASADASLQYQAKAFEVAIRDLSESHPEAANNPQVVEAILNAVLTLASAGQTDVDQLARYASHRGREAHLAQILIAQRRAG